MQIGRGTNLYVLSTIHVSKQLQYEMSQQTEAEDSLMLDQFSSSHAKLVELSPENAKATLLIQHVRLNSNTKHAPADLYILSPAGFPQALLCYKYAATRVAGLPL